MDDLNISVTVRARVGSGLSLSVDWLVGCRQTQKSSTRCARQWHVVRWRIFWPENYRIDQDSTCLDDYLRMSVDEAAER